ncbi:hypothetical protein ACRZ5S_22465 (plasmid) [Vibrio scophthalmi]|uniref:hypothetical protein n=1 Tax=Vibrio scophthalmi TaxID=45658 RepID=UPI003EBDFF91
MKSKFMALGRADNDQNHPYIIDNATSFEEAAEKAAIVILKGQDEDWEGDIYIDCVTNQQFEYECNFAFDANELR